MLQCRVDSSPPAQLELSKDGSLVASSALPAPATSPRLGVTAATNSLRVSIGDVLLEDEGEYVCAASNAYGNASTAANFTAGSECGGHGVGTGRARGGHGAEAACQGEAGCWGLQGRCGWRARIGWK